MGKLKDKILSLESSESDKIRDSRTALVDSVYLSNHPIRKKAISYIWAKYNMLPDVLTDSLGKLYEIAKDNYLPEKNYKSLFDYTHDKSSLYSLSISEKNITVNGGDGNEIREVSETPKERYVAWYNTAYEGSNYYETISDDIKGKTYTINKNSSSQDVINFHRKEAQNIENLKHEYESLKNKTKPTKPKKGDYTKDEYEQKLTAYKQELKEWKENKDKIADLENTLSNPDNLTLKPISIVDKTSQLYLDKKIETINDEYYNVKDNEYGDNIDSSIQKDGRSRGRSLLASEKNRTFNKPFARVWTFHDEYGKSKKTLIRHSSLKKKPELYSGNNINSIDYSVLHNGFVRITPENSGNSKYHTKKCMFSIENLAWKDVLIDKYLSLDQQGPNKGRIMWFPPYNLKFQENVNIQWNPTSFIGRGENIYTYTNTERRGTLSFTMLIDYPSVMNNVNAFNVNDGDILRFFAGTDDLPVKVKEIISDSNNTNKPTEEETAVPNKDENSTLNFEVFFPLNYSGEDDKDWAKYIFYGYDNVADFNENNARGYEMSDIGLNNEKSKPIKQNGCNYYYHRVDKNICNKQSDENNYKDTTSFLLNLTSSANDDNTISFGEFYTLVNLNDQNTKSWAIEKGILKDENGETVFKRDKLNNLKIEDFKDAEVTITPYTSNQNKKATDKLAGKRGKSVESFIRNKLTNVTNINVLKSYKEKKIENIRKAYDRTAKMSRGVLVEIKYNNPKIEGTSNEAKSSDNVLNKTNASNNNITTPQNIYYNEADYFLNLYEKNDFLREKIVEKVKYFEPAFHSISPEGFNSRLNFLQQCTRQGHTIERKANNSGNITSTAWNTAFGRPPVCVLRIGDFLNTKILIESMSITYDNGGGMQWDLNPEGIGVQPMFANISLGIIIIGGQSLDAPVSRLNNAISFNYYANTELYDRRADIGRYEDGIPKIKRVNVIEMKKIEVENNNTTPEQNNT